MRKIRQNYESSSDTSNGRQGGSESGAEEISIDSPVVVEKFSNPYLAAKKKPAPVVSKPKPVVKKAKKKVHLICLNLQLGARGLMVLQGKSTEDPKIMAIKFCAKNRLGKANQ
jgi:hypothetical protein